MACLGIARSLRLLIEAYGQKFAELSEQLTHFSIFSIAEYMFVSNIRFEQCI